MTYSEEGASNTSSIKRQARELLLGRYGVAIGAIVIMGLISFAISGLISNVADISTSFGIAVFAVSSIIGELVLYPIRVGEIELYMNMVCNNEVYSMSILKGFKEYPDKSIVIGLAYYIRQLPFRVVYLLFLLTIPGVVDFVSLEQLAFLGLVCGIFYMITAIPISQSFYLMLDFPDKGVGEILKMSKSLMKGNIWNFIKLYLSFIPIDLLGLLGFGFPSLVIRPYKTMSGVLFYMELLREGFTYKAPAGMDGAAPYRN